MADSAGVPPVVSPWARAADVVAIATATALAAGLLEVLVFVIQRFGFGTLVFAGYDLLWMAPLGTLMVVAPVALLLAIVVLLVARVPSVWIATAVFGFLGAFNVLLTIRQIHPAASALLAVGIATRLAMSGVRRPDDWRRWSRVTAAALLAVVIVLGTAVIAGRRIEERRAADAQPEPIAGAPNVLLLILDTVRSEDLGLYGFARATSPRIDAFARQGVVFDMAISPSSWTLPSHASMFTGLRPGELSARWNRPLDDAKPTIAEVLRDHGWRTAGFAANFVYAGELTGLERGFNRYRAFVRTPKQILWSSTLAQIPMLRAIADSRTSLRGILTALRRFRIQPLSQQERAHKSADEVVREFLRWDGGRGPAPFFAFLNFFDAHDRDEPLAAPFDTMFGPANDGRVKYDRMIARIDHAIGTLFDSLAARGRLTNTIVVITSDHGEHLGEHGLRNHGNSLYLPTLRVPLVIRAPGLPAGVRWGEPASLQNLAATILELTHVNSRMPGQSLLVTCQDNCPRSVAFSEVEQGSWWTLAEPARRGPLRSVIDRDWHYIRNAEGTEELYDMARDSSELHNAASTQTAVLERLRAAALAPASDYDKMRRVPTAPR